jgi:hypothetical protein
MAVQCSHLRTVRDVSAGPAHVLYSVLHTQTVCMMHLVMLLDVMLMMLMLRQQHLPRAQPGTTRLPACNTLTALVA